MHGRLQTKLLPPGGGSLLLHHRHHHHPLPEHSLAWPALPLPTPAGSPGLLGLTARALTFLSLLLLLSTFTGFRLPIAAPPCRWASPRS